MLEVKRSPDSQDGMPLYFSLTINYLLLQVVVLGQVATGVGQENSQIETPRRDSDERNTCSSALGQCLLHHTCPRDTLVSVLTEFRLGDVPGPRAVTSYRAPTPLLRFFDSRFCSPRFFADQYSSSTYCQLCIHCLRWPAVEVHARGTGTRATLEVFRDQFFCRKIGIQNRLYFVI